MVPIDNSVSDDQRGDLVFEKSTQYGVEVFFVPSKASLATAGLDPQKPRNAQVKLLDINSQNNSITIYPTDTRGWSDRFLKPKYDKIERITIADFSMWPIRTVKQWELEEVEGLLENLPRAFTKDYNYGLGLARDYRFIIGELETLLDCTEILITDKVTTGPSSDGEIFYITKDDFERIRLDIDRIKRLSQTAAIEVKKTTVHNVLAERLEMPKWEPSAGRHPLRKLFTDVAQGKTNLSKKDQNDIIGALSSNAINIAKDQPEKLAKLRTDIELVTLAELIKQFEEMMKKPLPERQWQSFFNKNPFILGLAFGNPVIKIGEQVFVGGRTISGAGDKITDFLVKNSLTDNAALVEIKTPRTILLNKRPVREGVYTPSADLSNAINQVLDQKYHLQRNIAQLKADSNTDNFESYSVRCYLIIGTLPFDVNSLKSFELFRGNSKDVEIVTFDELLENLKHLHDFLSNDGENIFHPNPTPRNLARN